MYIEEFGSLYNIKFKFGIMRYFIVSVCMLIGCLQLYGQENRKEVSVIFRVGNGTVDESFEDNAERLSEIIAFLKEVENDSTLHLVDVSFCGQASPEGTIAINRKLAAQRVASLERYVRGRVTIPDSVITRCEGFIAWERLAKLVEKSDMPHKDEALDVLRNVPEFTYNSRGVLADSRKKHLMDLQYGRTWNYMAKHFFPKVRHASAVFVTVWKKPEPAVVPEPVVVPEPEPEPEPVDTVVPAPVDTVAAVEPAPLKPFYMALKTNMLYDALAVPNIGIEFYLGKDWTVSADWMYGWWSKNSRHRYWRIYGGDIAVRKWFGRKAQEKPLTGHHLGVYGSIFTYDFEFSGKGNMGGKPGGTLWEKMNYAAGVEYGYSLPIARRLNIDFVIGVGYWGGKYYEYIPLDGCYVWQATKNRHWFGPTRAEVSLVWLLGRGNYNEKKGGMR